MAWQETASGNARRRGCRGAAVRGAPIGGGGVCRWCLWARRAASMEAISAACRSVCTEPGRSASLWSRRGTDVATLMRRSTSHRIRERSAPGRGPSRGGRFVRKTPDPWGGLPPTRRRCRGWWAPPTRPSASRARPSRPRLSSSRRTSRSLPGTNAGVTWPRARESTLGVPWSLRRMTKRPPWAWPARRRARLAAARSASRPQPRQDASRRRWRLSCSRAGLQWSRPGAPPPTERT
jgi:hypothetical protein